MTAASFWLKPRSKMLVTGLSLVAVGLLDAVDYSTTADIRFAVLHLFVALGAGWFGGRGAGLVVASAAAASRMAIEILTVKGGGNHWVAGVNFVGQWLVFAVVAVLAASMRELLMRMEERVAQRTLDLEKEVAERRRAESELRDNEELMRQLAENIREVFWLTDIEKKRMIYISPGYETIWGRTCKSLYESPRSWLDSIHLDDRMRVLSAAMNQASGSYDQIYRITRPDGTVRWIRDRAFPVHDRNGAIYRIAGIAEDVTAGKEAEQALRESEERFRRFMDNDSIIAFVKDEAGRYVYVNATLQKRFEFPLVGRTSFDCFPASVAARLHEKDRAVIVAGQTEEFTDSIPFPDGTVSDWINYKFPFQDGAGAKFVGCVSVEITEQRKLEKQLLEISDREQARIGHDVHDGLCQVLVGIAFDCNKLQRQLANASRTEGAQVEKISTLLDSAITEARQLARGLFPVQLEADGLISALKELSAAVSNRFKIGCEVECRDEIAIRDNVVATHLYRIAQEAVNNARQHGRAEHISINVGKVNSSLELVVRDDGRGLDPARNGAGLGLHIMDYRARSMGGSLTVESKPGAGTRVRCEVPLSRI